MDTAPEMSADAVVSFIKSDALKHTVRFAWLLRWFSLISAHRRIADR